MNATEMTRFGLLSLTGLTALLSASLVLAEDRADVLARIAPVGKVTVEGQAAVAPVAEAKPAEAAPAVAEAPAVQEAAPAAEAPAAAGGGDALAIATSSGCMGCHQVEVKVVGPAYKDVSAKYKGDAGALDRLVAKVKAGGSGTWGQIPMPPNAHVSDENIRTIVEWVLTL